MMSVILGLVLGCFFGYLVGWANAHHTVADECEKLGSFYVGSKVFRCVRIELKSSQQPPARNPAE